MSWEGVSILPTLAPRSAFAGRPGRSVSSGLGAGHTASERGRNNIPAMVQLGKWDWSAWRIDKNKGGWEQSLMIRTWEWIKESLRVGAFSVVMGMMDGWGGRGSRELPVPGCTILSRALPLSLILRSSRMSTRYQALCHEPELQKIKQGNMFIPKGLPYHLGGAEK